MKILFHFPLLVLMFAAGAIAEELPPKQVRLGKMAEAALEDPAKFTSVLINCAAYHGMLAARADTDETASKEHDESAVLLLTAANLVPGQDKAALDVAYIDKLAAFRDDLGGDINGTVEKSLMTLGAMCVFVEEYASATVLKANANAEEADRAPEALLEAEQEVVDTLFAEGTDGHTAYRGILMDCAAYHGTRARDGKTNINTNETAKEKLFLGAADAILPGQADWVGKEHAANLAKFSEALDHDATGEIGAEMIRLGKDCEKLEPMAQSRVAKTKLESDAAGS